METSYFTFPFLLVALSFFLSLCAQMTGNFKCNGSPSTCLSLVGYSSRNSTTLGNIQTLFSVKNLPLILEANNLPLSTTRAERVNPDQVVLIPIPCSCSDGTGVSNRVPVYTVKMSDTLFYIASEIFGGLVSFQKISEMNSITELIKIGQKLWIPLPCSCDKLDGQNVLHYAHMVKQGSTLGEIAAQFKTDITTLERLNDISGDTQLLADYPLNVALRVDERYTHCAPKFRCGNLTDLYYPFWTPEREECGHPDFKVNCSGDFAEFSKSSVKFRILEMNYDYDTIRLARMDYINNLCPQNPENATVNQQVLPFSRDTELVTFYYTCPDSMVNILPNGYIQQINCEVNIGGRSYFDSSRSNSTSCERNVNIPVSRSALKIAERNQSREAMKKALDDGFELNFSSDCSGCVRSGGACGHNKGSGAFVCYCIDGNHEHTCHFVKKSRLSRKVKIGIGLACGFLGTVSIAIGLVIFKISLGFRKRETSHYPRNHDLKALLQLKQYSYAEVRKITKSFSHTIGKGGFGIVYGGNLRDGRKVAVKILKDFKSNGEDFINEVASISQTSHVNIVSLLGFCYEGSKRAIVYEFLENGSLDQFISKKKSLNLDVSTLYGIALGVARGLEYLHHGCKTRIVHFDIKPQNVLLDDNLCPKVSDFGLAKLCQKRESILSLLDARGTIGYIAPEVFSGMYGRVSHKSDVYSYGMLVLEMVGVRNKETVGTTTSNCSSSYFPDWIYKDLENGEHIWKFGDDKTREEKEIAKKMTLVGLWCIQPCPSNRPPMNRVVEMMEGSLDALEVPPKPSLHLSAAPLAETSWLSEENSSHI